MHHNRIYPIERIISALTYFTAGGLGFVWLIIAAILKKRVTDFLMYHILQSIFISITYVVCVEILKLLYFILAKIPLINAIPYILSMPVFMGASIIQILTTTVMFYLAITAFCGQYSYFPWISDIIKANTRR